MQQLFGQVRAFLWTPTLRAITVTALMLLILSAPVDANSTFGASSSQRVDPLLPDLNAILIQANQDFYGSDLTGKDGPLEKIGYDLALLHAEYQAFLTQGASTLAFQPSMPKVSLLHTESGAYVVIEAIADQDTNNLRSALEAVGLQNGETFGAIVSGEMPILALPDLAALPTLRFAQPAIAVTDVGVAASQADRAMGTDNARSQFGLDGTGIKVGVLSDSYNCLGGAAGDVMSGDVPPDVEVLAEESRCATGKDEGRAMVQLIADIAPGADQTFHTAFGGQAAFANGILRLANDAQVDVIVDDVRYLMEPMFQDGIIAQAVEQVVAAGIPYFATAGNNARQAYESPFVGALSILPIQLPIQLPIASWHDFDPSSAIDTLQRVTIPVGGTATFNLQWDQPYASATGGEGAQSDLDMLLLEHASLSPIALAIDKNVGRDPIEILRYTNPGPGTSFDLAIVYISGPKPAAMKYVYIGSEIIIEEYATNSGTLYGHANAQGARAVGAAFYRFTPAFDTMLPIVELFSSAGPTPILYDHNDLRIHEVRRKPEFVAPDGVNTTFFGQDIADSGDDSDLDLYPNFFGTSAAAPNVAAVAALMLAANPTLSPSQLYAALEGSAIDMGEAGFDHDTGYGLVQAMPALEEVVAHDLVNTQKSVPATALPGQSIEYIVTLTNQGPNSTHLISLTNSAPTNVLNVVATADTDSVISLLATTSTWKVGKLGLGATHVMTVAGRVDPSLSTDMELVNQSTMTSVGDIQPTNNHSLSSVTVRVPRVQFGTDVAEGEIDGNDIYRVVIDQVNPYAHVIVRYTASSNKADTGYTPFSGEVTIQPGDSSATIVAPSYQGKAAVGETIILQLSQPMGSMLGSRTSVIIATNPDGDGDGVSDDEDDSPQNACIPSQQADLCDQEPDGLTNAEEAIHKTDPTNSDSDGDGIYDGFEVNNGSDPLDICDPTAIRDACDDDDDGGNDDGGAGDEDQDGDGIQDDLDIAPDNPCVPNQNSQSCRPSNHPDAPQELLYLPGIRGKTE